MSGCFVEASAGTGKTTALVNAIAEALAGGVRVERIARDAVRLPPAGRQERAEGLASLLHARLGHVSSWRYGRWRTPGRRIYREEIVIRG